MKTPEKSFIWRCDRCHKLQQTDGTYNEKREYECPSCKIKARILRKNVQYEVKHDPFTFECPYCGKIQHTRDYDYKGNINGYYVTETDCPDCKKHIAFKQPDPFHRQGFMFRCSCGHVTAVHSQYFPEKSYQCEECRSMVVPSEKDVMGGVLYE